MELLKKDFDDKHHSETTSYKLTGGFVCWKTYRNYILKNDYNNYAFTTFSEMKKAIKWLDGEKVTDTTPIKEHIISTGKKTLGNFWAVESVHRTVISDLDTSLDKDFSYTKENFESFKKQIDEKESFYFRVVNKGELTQFIENGYFELFVQKNSIHLKGCFKEIDRFVFEQEHAESFLNSFNASLHFAKSNRLKELQEEREKQIHSLLKGIEVLKGLK